jgi:cell division protein ZipA
LHNEESLLESEEQQDQIIATKNVIEENNEDTSDFVDDEIITIYLIAQGNKTFEGYELLQAILDNGLHYEQDKMFHHYADDYSGAEKQPLFSLACATDNGEFDLSRIGAFSCNKLILFMKTSSTDNPTEAYEQMLQTAKQLAEDLQAELETNPKVL